MLEPFYPDYEADSAYSIDYEKLYRDGYRGVIFDIDNTLVPHGAPADERATALFARLRGLGFQTILLSNNKEPRVKSFNDGVGSQYIFKAGKPGKDGYEKAMEKMGTTPQNTLFVGDQLFKVGAFLLRHGKNDRRADLEHFASRLFGQLQPTLDAGVFDGRLTPVTLMQSDFVHRNTLLFSCSCLPIDVPGQT